MSGLQPNPVDRFDRHQGPHCIKGFFDEVTATQVTLTPTYKSQIHRNLLILGIEVGFSCFAKLSKKGSWAGGMMKAQLGAGCSWR